KGKSETFGLLKPAETWDKYQSVSDLSPEPDLTSSKSKSLKSIEDFKDDNLPPLQIEMCL
ncbi:hypothetical protein, partial [Vibrio parahaemolyticus]